MRSAGGKMTLPEKLAKTATAEPAKAVTARRTASLAPALKTELEVAAHALGLGKHKVCCIICIYLRICVFFPGTKHCARRPRRPHCGA
jgi:hypothetical protein